MVLSNPDTLRLDTAYIVAFGEFEALCKSIQGYTCIYVHCCAVCTE